MCPNQSTLYRFMSLTSKNQIRIKHWMTSTRIIRITSGFVYFAIIYGVTTSIINALLELNIFPTYTICLMDSEVDNIDNSLVLAFFVMPSVFMAYTTPIFDFVTFRLMKFWSHRSQQIPPGIEYIQSFTYLGNEKAKNLCIFRLSKYSITGYSGQYITLDFQFPSGFIF